MRCRIKFDPTLSLKKHRTTDDFIIVNFAIDPDFGWLADSGPLIYVDKHDLRSRGPDILLEHLLEFANRSYKRGELANMTIVEKKRFRRLYDAIAVRLKSESQLELQPMVPVPGKMGARGDKKDAILVRLPTNPEKLWESLILAYSRCHK